uniref:Dynein assembly factor with WD repeat domains 1 n=1 Tax=Macrostomum lignano TaxID=282301 RepID=A0A1I8IZ95_9PLAT
VWDVRQGRVMQTLGGHEDEVLDVAFDLPGHRLASASADATGRCWDIRGSFRLLCKLEGHEGEVSKVCFNPQGTRLLTASADKTARLWDCETGKQTQALEGHTDEIFSCAFNYEGNTIITGSKDNTCRPYPLVIASEYNIPALLDYQGRVIECRASCTLFETRLELTNSKDTLSSTDGLKLLSLNSLNWLKTPGAESEFGAGIGGSGSIESYYDGVLGLPFMPRIIGPSAINGVKRSWLKMQHPKGCDRVGRKCNFLTSFGNRNM